MIYRKIEGKIINWINNSNKALLIDGARQVGKSTTIEHVLKQQNCNFVKFNLLEDAKFSDYLNNLETFSVEDFLEALSINTNHKLVKGQTIIFIDEVQICRELFTMIKFLVEEGSYKYILSGSILGIELARARSVPVGYLELEKMYPLDFEEFAWAFGVDQEIIRSLENSFHAKKPVNSFVHEKMMDLFNKYLIIGGMPDAVQNFLDNHNYNDVHKIHKHIINLYKDDFSKYQNNDKKLKLMAAYDLIPAEINSQNKRYQFSNLNKSFRFERYEATFEWLWTAEVAIPIFNAENPEMPLLINKKSRLFKMFLNDVGLLTSMYGVPTIKKILNKNKNINYGAIYENYVAQELHAHEYAGYYYKNKKFGEIDFVIEDAGEVLPIEVKSGKAYARHSALDNIMSSKTFNINKAFVLSNENISHAVISTLKWKEKYFKIREEYTVVYLPIYMTMFLDESKINLDEY